MELVDGNVYVNGSLLEEPLIHEPTWGLMGQVVVSPDHLFVMGDNRTNSRDSRNFGELPMELVVGKAWLRIWPFNKFGWVPHQVSLDEAAAMRDR
ncbi:MAG: signal peptidase I [Caldilineaceae bacterium]